MGDQDGCKENDGLDDVVGKNDGLDDVVGAVVGAIEVDGIVDTDGVSDTTTEGDREGYAGQAVPNQGDVSLKPKSPPLSNSGIPS